MRKYARSESMKVLTPKDHKVVQESLRKEGRTSAVDMTDEQREKFSRNLTQAR